MTTKLKWRLGKLPDALEVAQLLKEGILTKDEAREILFSLETDEDRDKKSLQDEIKFLRELVQSMASKNSVSIVDTIRYLETPNRSYGPWYQPYQVWCQAGDFLSSNASQLAGLQASGSATTTNLLYSGSNSALYSSDGTNISSIQATFASQPEFKDIKTF